MKDITYKTGMIELAVQGDQNKILRFNPADEGIISGFLQLLDNSKNKFKEAVEKENKIYISRNLSAIEKIKEKNKVHLEIDAFLRKELDQLLGEGTADMVFEKMCVTATTETGESVFMSFIIGLLGVVESENKKRNQRVSELVARYKPQNQG